MKKLYTISPDSFSEQEVRTVCDKMDALFEDGFYPHLEIFASILNTIQDSPEKWLTLKFLGGI